ncbi:GNAT family N-acetyltransferase [Polaribacter sp. AHE13PA]|jgi:GNAT superfamily N-acetyltransferase|uniref:GNAT family N-acetyltransferase n=1 Tax=Polaribacter sp. AHE13PA TaxID=2745562 RepID=UPI001C4FD50B|nr:GNAT family N-acetyltransferase [Polaribacter sp. AHE13PA]QXP66240.1 GNAT family N-acetyltransferase [Polaribacter sp. AHE13PA]
MKIDIIRTNSEDRDFINLVKELDAYLKITDGEEHAFYNQFNNIDVLKNVVVVSVDKKAVGCGAIKKFDNTSVEVKRMFVSKDDRGKGVAQKVLQELETWAKELGCKKCVLETGKRQVEAVKFYQKCNYKVIENYGQYKEMENSVCFEKAL